MRPTVSTPATTGHRADSLAGSRRSSFGAGPGSWAGHGIPLLPCALSSAKKIALRRRRIGSTRERQDENGCTSRSSPPLEAAFFGLVAASPAVVSGSFTNAIALAGQHLRSAVPATQVQQPQQFHQPPPTPCFRQRYPHLLPRNAAGGSSTLRDGSVRTRLPDGCCTKVIALFDFSLRRECPPDTTSSSCPGATAVPPGLVRVSGIGHCSVAGNRRMSRLRDNGTVVNFGRPASCPRTRRFRPDGIRKFCLRSRQWNS